MNGKSYRLFLMVPLALTLIQVSAQAQPVSLWSKTYGGISLEFGECAQWTNDGGYVIVGRTEFEAVSSVWLIKTDSYGDSIWSRTYGGSASTNLGLSVQQTTEGGYIIAGGTTSFGGADTLHVYLIKTDSVGNLIWQHTYGYGNGLSVQQTSDGGYIIAGWGVVYQPQIVTGILLTKTDAAGNLLWSQMYLGGADCAYGYSVQQTTEGGYIVAGYCSQNPTNADVCMLKTDAAGTMLWFRTYGSTVFDDVGFCARETTDGGYILTGFSVVSIASGGKQVYLLKTDANGEVIWARTIGDSLVNEEGHSVQQTIDGGYIIAGNGNHVYLIRTNANGDTLWTRDYGGNAANSVQITPQGDYIIGGKFYFQEINSWDVYLVKVSEDPMPTVALGSGSLPFWIPASGGSFNYYIVLWNNTLLTQTFDAWLTVRLPNGYWFGPLVGPLTITMPPSGVFLRQRSQSVPGAAPAGAYTYEGRVGVYPDSAWSNSSFAFTKLGSGDGGVGISAWSNTGESFCDEEIAQNGEIHNSSFLIHNLSPNPFNPSTAISFELRAASYVNLRVYDTTGRLVTTLVDGWQGAGQHRATFYGSELPSGVYLYRLEAGGQAASGKMVLLK